VLYAEEVCKSLDINEVFFNRPTNRDAAMHKSSVSAFVTAGSLNNGIVRNPPWRHQTLSIRFKRASDRQITPSNIGKMTPGI
jgi:hypothetical protein